MLAAERHHQILEALKERGSLRTKEVASDLDVTDETIRKDFELLDKSVLHATHFCQIRINILIIGITMLAAKITMAIT